MGGDRFGTLRTRWLEKEVRAKGAERLWKNQSLSEAGGGGNALHSAHSASSNAFAWENARNVAATRAVRRPESRQMDEREDLADPTFMGEKRDKPDSTVSSSGNLEVTLSVDVAAFFEPPHTSSDVMSGLVSTSSGAGVGRVTVLLSKTVTRALNVVAVPDCEPELLTPSCSC